MNNTLKILDDAIQITLKKHPEEIFRSSLALGLSMKMSGHHPETYAKTFTSTNFARQKIIEINAEKVKEEIGKNAIKVLCLLARKKCSISENKSNLEAGNHIIGETACGKLVYELKQQKSLTEILNNQELSEALCKTFIYARYIENEKITKEELDSSENLKYCQKYFYMIDLNR